MVVFVHTTQINKKKRSDRMSNISVYSKDKNELNEKIISLINSKELGREYRRTLKEWHNWFIDIYEELEMPVLEDPEFYRAFYSSPDYYSIQIWRKSTINDKMRQYSYTLYSNKMNIELFEKQTRIVNSKADFKNSRSTC